MSSHTTTVLDSLTWPNPEIRYGARGGTLHKSTTFLRPRKIVPWTEFNMETIASIGGGRLLRTIQATPALLAVPPDLDVEHCVVEQEQETESRFLIEQWSHCIVQKGLNSVKDQLPICKWNPGIKAKASKGSSILTTASTSYASTPASKGPAAGSSPSMHAAFQYWNDAVRRMRRIKKLHPDAGATAPCKTHGSLCPASLVERLPKDYKAATKWRSWEALDLLLDKDNSGNWGEGLSGKQPAWPLRQAYTYCVEFGCRYGCILTTEEAFVFRIRPVSATDRSQQLESMLRQHGLMEYASIPWSEPDISINTKGKGVKQTPSLTFNLAVWFIHVLAAAKFHPDWTYDALSSEDIEIHECTAIQIPVTPESETRRPQRRDRDRVRSRTRSRKRAREDTDETYTLSFTTAGRGLTDSFRSRQSDSDRSDSERGDSERSDVTCLNEGPRWQPTSSFAVPSDQDKNLELVKDNKDTGDVELRRSKRVRAQSFNS